VVSPLLPVLLTLALAALGLSLLFARLFPRPVITAPAITFTDVTAESGLRFAHQAGGLPAPSTLGGSVVVLDFNSDGAPDLFFVNSAPWTDDQSLAKQPGRGNALFRNDGRGRFTDVSAAAGLNVTMPGMTATAGDFDADGWTDLFVTGVGTNRLFRNLGNGRFEDVTELAGVGGDENCWSTGAAWLDVDADGRLDLVVLHYVRWPREVGLRQAFTIAELGRSYGAPAGFSGSFPTVFRNLGDGRFASIPGAAGLRDIDPETGRPVAQPVALATLDANEDGRLDLLIAYHADAPALFVNQADGTFSRLGLARERRQEGATALLAAGSLPAVEGAEREPRTRILAQLVQTGGDGGDLASLRSKLGVALADFDLDSRIEVFSGEGVVEARLRRPDPAMELARRPALLRRDGERWTGGGPAAANAWSPAILARGVARADFDGDGDPDIVIAQNGGPALLLRNDQRRGWPWLRLRLVAKTGHPDAAGAQVEVHTPRRVLRQTVGPALGFMAQSEDVLTFGLGDDSRVRRIVIRWPSGRVQELAPPELNRTHVLREP
jgi:enediyne biosynthesis protein E4